MASVDEEFYRNEIKAAEPFCGGCLVVEGPSFQEERSLAERVAASGAFDDWQLIVLHDNIEFAMKPWYPKEVEPREDIVKLVDGRWGQYFG